MGKFTLQNGSCAPPRSLINGNLICLLGMLTLGQEREDLLRRDTKREVQIVPARG